MCSWYGLKTLDKQGQVHQGGLVVFRPTTQELLNIEQFCQKERQKEKKPKLNIKNNLGQALRKLNFQ